jgi:RNA polymerase sigma-70 factor (ECF subfamily)
VAELPVVEARASAPASARESDAVGAAVRAVRAGDRDAFAVIVAELAPRLRRFTLALSRDPAAADELAHAAFVRSYLHLDAFDEDRRFYPWLARIAYRLAQDRRAEAAAPAEADVPVAGSALDGLLADERHRGLWEAVGRLPQAQRAAVLLYYRDELGLAEVGQVLGLAVGTIKALLFRARGRLRALLEET